MVYIDSRGRLCHSFTLGTMRSIISLRVLWEISTSYISSIWEEISLRLKPIPYRLIILEDMLSARIVSRFLRISVLKLLWRSWGVTISISPAMVLTRLLPRPFRLLPLRRSESSRWEDISPSKAASKNSFSNGPKAPSLPVSDSPLRSWDNALSRICWYSSLFLSIIQR